MDQLGIEIQKEDPTFASQVQEKRELLESLPANDELLYSKWKRLEAHKDFLSLQEVSEIS